MKMTPMILFLAVLLICFAASAQAAHYKVILMGGQSNMDGRAPGSGLPTSPVNLQAAQTDVKLYHGNASGQAYLPGNTWINLAPGSGSKSPSSPTFGPEVTFGRAIADAYPTENFALIKYALGGSKLATQWYAPNGPVYASFRTTVANGLAGITAAGHTYEIVSMCWMQGESDSTLTYANAYQANLTALIQDIRSRYGANLSFVIAETWRNEGDATHPGSLGDIVSAAQQNVANADPRVGFVSTRSLTFQDAYHLNASGQMNLGYGMADYLIENNLLTSSPANNALTLSPVADAYIDIRYTGNNYGTAAYMNTNNDSSKIRWSFIKFDLSSILEPIVGVTLELQASKEGNSFPPLSHAIYGLTTGEGWTESGTGSLNWTNAPARSGSAVDMAGVYGSAPISTFDYAGVVSGNTGGPVAAVIDQFAGGDAVDFINTDSDKVVTFIIARTGSASSSGVAWATKECAYADVAKPVLTVWTGVVANPNPADGQGLATDPLSLLYPGADISTPLSWQPVSDSDLDPAYTITYAVYADPNQAKVIDADPLDIMYFREFTGSRSYTPPSDFEYNTPLHWRVDSKVKWIGRTEPNIVTGNLWTFKTISNAPDIITDPAAVTKTFVNGSHDVQLALTYQSGKPIIGAVWYQGGGALQANCSSVWDQGSAVLTITGVTAANLGSYHCEIATMDGTAVSAPGLLLEKKKLAWYKFDNNADDSVGTNHGTPVNGMVYTPSDLITGQTHAADPNGVYLMLPKDTCYPRAGFNNGLDQGTIACWVRCAAGHSGTIHVLGQNAGTSGQYVTSLQLYIENGNLIAFLRNDDNQSVTLAGSKVDDGQWHYVALTIDGGNVTLYVDVTNVKSGSNVLDNYRAWDYDMPIMAFNNRGILGNFFTADLDDLVITNWPMTQVDLADVYYEVKAVGSCLNPYVLGYDVANAATGLKVGDSGFTQDCKIDLADFAAFAEAWLETGLYPQ